MAETFTTSRGVVLRFRPMQGELDRLTALQQSPRFNPPAPFYVVKTATGGEEKHQHDETTLETDADRAEWAQYQANKTAATAAYTEILVKSVIVNGVERDDTAVVEWVATQQFLGKPVPATSVERHFEWVLSEAVGTPGDVQDIIAGVFRASEIPEEVIAQAEASFRHPVGRTERNAAGPGSAAAGQVVVDESAVRASAGGAENGQMALGVRRRERRGSGLRTRHAAGDGANASVGSADTSGGDRPADAGKQAISATG